MEVNLFLSKLIGLTCFFAGLGLLINHKNLAKGIMKYVKDEFQMFFWGMMTFVIGFVILFNHCLWETPSEIIVTLFGWLAVIKGVLLMLLPNKIWVSLAKSVNTTTWSIIKGLVVVLVGLYLASVGFGVL